MLMAWTPIGAAGVSGATGTPHVGRNRPGRASYDRPPLMDLEFTPAEETFRAECRAWLEANVPRPALPSGDTRAGFAAHLEWERKLFDARYAVVSWPQEFGGRDASLWEWLIFEEEYYRAGAPQRVTQNGIFLLAPTIFEFGTPEQQARILAQMASGEQTWCQGWSEPNAGSDLAGIQSKAVRDDAAGGWRLSGQKTWTTRGAFCTHLFGLFRSDPDAERHHGLTYFLVDLATPGRDRARRRTPRRRRRIRRGVPRRRVRPRRRRARRAEPGLGGGDGDHRLRTRPHAAFARPFPRDRATPDRPLPRPAATTRSCANGSPPRTSTPRRTAGRRSGPSRVWSRA